MPRSEERVEGVAAPATLFTCHHPYGLRRVYKVHNGGTEAVCQVCYSCAAVRSVAEGLWPHGLYVFRDGDLYNVDGSLRIREYFAWRQRAPVNA